MTEAVIAGYLRSPFTFAGKGELSAHRPDNLAAQVLRALLQRTGVTPADIEDLILGCAFPEGEQGLNLGRVVGNLAGLPASVAGMTVNRWCGSSMQAIQIAAGAIATGAGEVFVCGGVESMSRVPMPGLNCLPPPQWTDETRSAYLNMGMTAEIVAERYGIARTRQDAYAARSQTRAAEAQEAGRFADEIIAIGEVKRDGCVRAGTTAEKLATLTTLFKENGTVSAGNSSPLTDGAAMTLVCSAEYARRHGQPVLARIRAFAVSGCAPEVMGIGPVEASRKALKRAGIAATDLDVIEMNEAFAAQVLACCDQLGVEPERINRDGGAIAVGHPLGATGARLVGKASLLLKRDGGRWALATQCIGGGQGIAMVLEAA
ncbi:MAG: thiolase family protein [Defluviicoccus sp.]